MTHTLNLKHVILIRIQITIHMGEVGFEFQNAPV